MFVGRLSYSVDSKGRLSIPSEFRAVLAQQYGTEELWVTTFKEVDSTRPADGEPPRLRSAPLLHAYPRQEWDKVVATLGGASGYDPELVRIRRHFISGATQAIPDKQGRIALTSAQRVHAGIESEVMFVGNAVRFIEIWDLATFDRWQREDEDSAFAGIGKLLQGVGL